MRTTWTKTPKPPCKVRQALLGNASPLLLGNNLVFRSVSWNAWALLSTTGSLRAKKINKTIKMARSAALLAIQEVHGSKERFLSAFKVLHNTHWLFFSGCRQEAAGGVATFVNKNFFPANASANDRVIVNGRALLVEISFNNRIISHLNVHNEAFTVDQTKRLCSAIEDAGRLSCVDSRKRAAIVQGDFNFADEDAESVELSSKLTRFKKQHSAKNSADLCRSLRRYTEVCSDDFTQFNRRGNSMSTIDRAFICIPAWVLAVTNVGSKVLDNAVNLLDAGLSDHAPVSFSVSQLNNKSEDAPSSIPGFICKDHRFAELHQKIIDAAKLDDLPDAARWEMHKTILIEIAKKVRAERLIESDLCAF